MSNLSSSSSITPTPSAFQNTPTPTHPSSAYAYDGPRAPGAHAVPSATGVPPPPSPNKSRIPVSPAVLRSIFASSRTVLEERSLSRVAVMRRFTGFLLSCMVISLAAARGRVIKGGAALLGVGVA
ncbi:hypothetical protein C8Q77DRAFT_1047044 [Trametes polyzona]|nr:hypothetical protein C8Q77DRAFT_1047044 [Trametes polyzona]